MDLEPSAGGAIVRGFTATMKQIGQAALDVIQYVVFTIGYVLKWCDIRSGYSVDNELCFFVDNHSGLNLCANYDSILLCECSLTFTRRWVGCVTLTD